YEIRRRPPPGTVFIPRPVDPAAERMQDLLALPITTRLEPDTSLKETVEILNTRYDLDIRIDEAAFRKAGKPQIAEAKVECQLPNFPFHAIMQVLLNQVDAQFEVRGGTIWILPATKPQSLAERLHPARRRDREWIDRSVDMKGVEGEVPLSEALKK